MLEQLFAHEHTHGPAPVSPPAPAPPPERPLHLLPPWLASFCPHQGVCAEHVHYAAQSETLGPVLVTLPLRAIEAPTAQADAPSSDTHFALVRTALGPSRVAVPPFVGKGRPSVNAVLQHLLQAYAVQTGDARWRELDAGELLPCQDQRVCFTAAQMERAYHAAADYAVNVVTLDEEKLCRDLVARVFGEPHTSLKRRATLSSHGATPAKVKADEEKRRSLQMEMLETERSYVRQLYILHDKYYMQLVAQTHSKQPLISSTDLGVIFSGLPKIVQINRDFLRDLERALAPDTANKGHGAVLSFEQVFDRHAKSFQEYTQYINYYQASLDTLQRCMGESRAFATFLEACKDMPGCDRKDLRSLLIEPVQRIARYALLLKTMLECTSHEHEQRALLQNAYDKMNAVASYINSTKLQADTRVAIFAVQQEVDGCPHTIISATRQYLGRIDCQEHDLSSGKLRGALWSLYLFDDFLLLAEKTHKTSLLSKKWQRKFVRLVDVAKIAVTSYPNEEGLITLAFPSAAGAAGTDQLSLVLHASSGMTAAAATAAGAQAQDSWLPTVRTFAELLEQAALERRQKIDMVQVMVAERLGRKIEYTVRTSLGALCLPAPPVSTEQPTHVTVLVVPDAFRDLPSLLPELMLDDTFMLVVFRCLANGGFKVDVRSRFADIPPFGPDVRGHFDSDAAASFGPVLAEKILRAHVSYAEHILHRTNYAASDYREWLQELLASAALATTTMERSRSVHRRSSFSLARTGSSSSLASVSSVSSVASSASTRKSMLQRTVAAVKRSSTITSTTAKLAAANAGAAHEATETWKPLLRAFSLVSRDGRMAKPPAVKAPAAASVSRLSAPVCNARLLIDAIEAKGLHDRALYTTAAELHSPKRLGKEAVAALLPPTRDALISPSAVRVAPLGVLCAVLVAYLRDKVGPLLPASIVPRLVEACNWQYPLESIALLRRTLQQVAPDELELVRLLLTHLKRVCNSPGNMCNFVSLDELFARVFLPLDAPVTQALATAMDIAAVVAVQEKMPAIVARLIEHVDEIFGAPVAPVADTPAISVTPNSEAEPVLLIKLSDETKRRRITPTEPLQRLMLSEPQAQTAGEDDGGDEDTSSSDAPSSTATLSDGKENSDATTPLDVEFAVPSPGSRSAGKGLLGSIAEANLRSKRPARRPAGRSRTLSLTSADVKAG